MAKKIEVNVDRLKALSGKIVQKLNTAPASPKTGIRRAQSNYAAISVVRTPAHENTKGVMVPEMCHVEFRHEGKTFSIRDEKSRQALLYLLESPTTARAFLELGQACISLNPAATRQGEDEPEEGMDII